MGRLLAQDRDRESRRAKPVPSARRRHGRLRPRAEDDRRGGSSLSLLALGASLTLTALAGIPQVVHAARISSYDVLPVCRVRTEQPIIALTFDDGPDPEYTPSVLALLRDHASEATFFVTGENAAAFPVLVRRELKAGMEIANHTLTHPHLDDLPIDAILKEVVRTRDIISRAGASGSLFRAPYGEIDPQGLTEVVEKGLRPIHWSLALDHYVGGMGLTPEEAAVQLLRDVRPGDIILAHDARIGPRDEGEQRASALASLRLLLPALEERGMEVTTVSELLTRGTPVVAQPRPWFWQSGFTCPRGP